MTPVPSEMLSLAGERVEVTGRAGRPGAYFAGPTHWALPLLLLVHSVNAAGCAAEMRPLFDPAHQTRPVLGIDLPGFGISDRNDRAYTPAR
jgi:pimeloyl-ACP methyl ester carboxylesterase